METEACEACSQNSRSSAATKAARAQRQRCSLFISLLPVAFAPLPHPEIGLNKIRGENAVAPHPFKSINTNEEFQKRDIK